MSDRRTFFGRVLALIVGAKAAPAVVEPAPVPRGWREIEPLPGGYEFDIVNSTGTLDVSLARPGQVARVISRIAAERAKDLNAQVVAALHGGAPS